MCMAVTLYTFNSRGDTTYIRLREFIRCRVHTGGGTGFELRALMKLFLNEKFLFSLSTCRVISISMKWKCSIILLLALRARCGTMVESGGEKY